jgi:SulP family sulfate permease
VIPEWINRYDRRDLRGDLSAGLVVAIMLVPQGMAYAMLAGLPPVIGLYASTFPVIAYALVGSSRQLAVGPVAMISLLVFSGLSKVAEPGSPAYISLALTLAFMVGVTQLAMGLFRMGSFSNFISHAVISGFTSAAAIVILLSQLSHLVGIDLSAKHSVAHVVMEAGQRIGETHGITLAIGLLSMGVLVLFKKRLPRFPAPLLVVVGTTLAVYLFGLDRLGVRIVGPVPQGLPGLSVPAFELDVLGRLVPTAVAILFVGFMESIAIAESIATRERYAIDSNRELEGLGLANLVGSFFSGYPVTGGFSRTAVNYQAGARTDLASTISAVFVIITVLFFTSLFRYLPKAVLAAIVMVAVMDLIDVREARDLFHVKRMDGWTMTITFIATLAWGSQKGILLGVAFSLLVFIWRSAHPHTAEIGYMRDDDIFRDVKRFPQAERFPGVLILRIDASLYFANMAFLERFIRRSIVERPEVSRVVLDLSGVNDIDAVAIRRLEGIIDDYQERGIEFVFAGMKGPVRDLVARAGWEKKYGEHIRPVSVKRFLEELELIKESR